MSVVAGAAAFFDQAEAPVEGDGRRVAGADFEGEMAGAVLEGPGEDGAEEGGSEALAARCGMDGYGVELADVLLAIEQKGGGGEGEGFCLAACDEGGSVEGRVGGSRA